MFFGEFLMQNVPVAQQALFGASSLQVLLDEAAPTAVLAPMRFRKLHRDSECVMPVGQIKLVFRPKYSGSVSRSAVSYFKALVQTAACIVMYSQIKHDKSELSHYFDRIWVVTGDKLERLVCYQDDDTCTFTILQHFPQCL